MGFWISVNVSSKVVWVVSLLTPFPSLLLGEFVDFELSGEEGGGGGHKWQDGERLEEIAQVLNWPVHFAHRTPAFGQNDREKACVVCQVMCPPLPPLPIPSLPLPPPLPQAVLHSPFSPKHTCRISLSHTRLSLSLPLTRTHTHTHVSRKLPVSLVLSLSQIHTHSYYVKTANTDEWWGRGRDRGHWKVRLMLDGDGRATLTTERWGKRLWGRGRGGGLHGEFSFMGMRVVNVSIHALTHTDIGRQKQTHTHTNSCLPFQIFSLNTHTHITFSAFQPSYIAIVQRKTCTKNTQVHTHTHMHTHAHTHTCTHTHTQSILFT